jgi:hypothetical protein
MVRRCPALAISDTVHVVSIERADDRDNPESGEVENRRGFFASGWDEEVASPSIFSVHEDGALFAVEGAKHNFLQFTACLHAHV